MEVRIRGSRTIRSVFFRYICFYTVGALFWMFVIFIVYFILHVTGEILPANHMEVQLNASADDIRKAPKVTEDMLPKGCTYGVYEYDGTWMYGTFSPEETARAWEHYEANSIYGSGKRYYRFFARDTKEVCIVRYEIATQFRNTFLDEILPSPDILAVFSFVGLFLVHTVLVSRHYGRYMRKKISALNEVTAKIRNQDLEFEEEHSEIKEVDEVLGSLHQMKEALRDSLYRQWNLEKTKEEQIAALAHDIKTPLTSIINYVNLLKQENFEDPRLKRYLEVLDAKSQRLKTLTEDVVEASKVSSGNITLEFMNINLVEMIQQTSGEFEEKFKERNLTEVMSLPDHEVIIRVDGRRLWRVLANVYNNAAKYAMEGTRIYADVYVSGNTVIFSLKNVSDQPLNISADELTERFIRGDISRSTEGSGLGLSIAKTLTEMQGGRFELYLDGDLFRVTITFPLALR